MKFIVYFIEYLVEYSEKKFRVFWTRRSLKFASHFIELSEDDIGRIQTL